MQLWRHLVQCTVTVGAFNCHWFDPCFVTYEHRGLVCACARAHGSGGGGGRHALPAVTSAARTL